MLTNQGQRISKSEKHFGILSRLTSRQRLTLEQLMSKDRDQRKEYQQSRSGAQDGKVGPLSLRRRAQMSTYLMECHIHLLSQNKPLQDGLSLSLLIGTQKSLGIELPLRVPNEYPTDRNRWHSLLKN
jgi:hypothetical protein